MKPISQGPAAGEGWKTFNLDELIGAGPVASGSYNQFIDEASLSLGIYELRAGARDTQTPHWRDEIYYILEGRAALQVQADDLAVEPGSIVYVPARAEHAFREITEDLRTLVIFSKSPSSEADAAHLSFHLSDILAEGDPDENVWAQFLDVASMRFGLYLLPASIGGDDTLVHAFDEVNIVVSGRGQFRMGDDVVGIQPGSIMYVEAGIGHRFEALESDLAVLILFEVRP